MPGWRGALVCGLLAFLLALPACAQGSEVPATLPPPSQDMMETPLPLAERPLAAGDEGDDAYLLKLRLQYLGYFKQGSSLSDRITGTTLERVNQLLADNGMEPVEIITTDIQEMIFSRDDLAIVPTPTPAPTKMPLIAPMGAPELPELDAEGFLPDVDGEYVFSDNADGLWYYISHDLYVNVRRYNDLEEENIWLEAEIKTRGGEQMQSYHEEARKVYKSPVDLARSNRSVLAFTDDFFVKRNYGIVIRDGEVYRNYIRRTSKSYPLGDSLAMFPDGTMRTYDYDAYSADEFLAMGAVHVLSFGPWLIRDGAINPRVLTDTYMHYHEPRCALGMIEPGHYVVITVDGRYDGAKGVYFSWLATRMWQMGVTEGFNLDGGGTTAMVFMGTQISRVASAKPDGSNTRRVSSMLGFGVSDAVPN